MLRVFLRLSAEKLCGESQFCGCRWKDLHDARYNAASSGRVVPLSFAIAPGNSTEICTVDKIMPKQKTHKGMKKRFKITASGKAKHRNAFRGHILGKKSGDRKRRLRQDGVVTGADAVHIVEALRPGM